MLYGSLVQGTLSLLFTVVMILTTLQSPYQSGGIAYYRKGLMGKVARVRIEQGLLTAQQVDTYECLAASLGREIGDVFVLERNDTQVTCLVVDVAHPKDEASIRRRGIIAEVDYYTASIFKCIDIRPKDCTGRILTTGM